jgi:TPP-dependent pyruvate/acetoin dehydrogenase alpha subunit
MNLLERLYYKMQLIRETENEIERLFSTGILRGTTHGSKGQEAVPSALLTHIDPEKDYISGGHRSHGHLLALSEDVRSLIAELMTKKTGYVQGKGGSQHVRYKNFFCNGITGGMVPVAVGLGFALKQNTKDGISVVFFGDGAMNEGYVMEAFNLASVLKLPVLFVLENNSFAMSTASTYSNAASFKERINGFGIEYNFLEAVNALEINKLSLNVIKKMRFERNPQFIEFKTHRFSGHSKSDNRSYIPSEMDKYWTKNDPISNIKKYIKKNRIIEINTRIKNEIDYAVELASKDPYPEKIY